MGERSRLFWIVSACLTLAQLSSTLTIDNQLAVIKNDCYERLAIGQRLHPTNIYQMHQLNTVPDCQQACTKEGDKCKSLSFGISAKGNATCDLSMTIVHETVDLKPIGTVGDTDYDLYIKKLGCKLVIEPSQSSTSSSVPSESGIGYANSDSSTTSIKSKPLYQNKPSYGGEEVHQVQTLISIRPNIIGMKPIIEDDSTKPPLLLPSNFDVYPQDDFRPQTGHYDDSRPDYSLRPEYYIPEQIDYARPSHTRPLSYDDRPFASRPSPFSLSYGISRPTLEYRPFEDDRPIGGGYYNGNQIYRPHGPIRPIMEDGGYNTRPPIRPVMEDDGMSRPLIRPINEDVGGYSPIIQSKPIVEDNGYNSNSRPPLQPIMDGNGYNSRPSSRPIVEVNRHNNNDDRRVYKPEYHQIHQFNSGRPNYLPYSDPEDGGGGGGGGGYGSSYGSRYSNYQPSKLTEILSDYDRFSKPIKTIDDDISSSPYGIPNSPIHRPVQPAYDARPYEEDLPPFRPSSLSHPYHEHSFFRPGLPDYDPGPVRDQHRWYEVLMTKPSTDLVQESGYRDNKLDPNKGGKSNGQRTKVYGKPMVSYNVGKNGEKIVGIIREIGFEKSKFTCVLF